MDLTWLSLPLSVLWLVGITNAFNLADGLDGLATGIATFAALILFFMTYAGGYSVVALMAIALAGAALGFLRYNFYPATIFLGDSGSLFPGFLPGRTLPLGLRKKHHYLCPADPHCGPGTSPGRYALRRPAALDSGGSPQTRRSGTYPP